MNILNLIVTVFDAMLMFVIGFVGVTAKDKKQLRTCIYMLVIMILNVFCIWG